MSACIASLFFTSSWCVDIGVEMSVRSLDYLVANLFVDMGIELEEVAFFVWVHLNIRECILWMDAFYIVGSVFNLSHITHSVSCITGLHL